MGIHPLELQTFFPVPIEEFFPLTEPWNLVGKYPVVTVVGNIPPAKGLDVRVFGSIVGIGIGVGIELFSRQEFGMVLPSSFRVPVRNANVKTSIGVHLEEVHINFIEVPAGCINDWYTEPGLGVDEFEISPSPKVGIDA